jgi:colanic acid biosynthesis glycosyl transferase WcaI
MLSAWKRFWGGSSTRRWRAEEGTEGVATPKIRSLIRPTKATRILFVNQYYWPDHASTAQHLTDLAESLAERGHDVHVLCGRGGYKTGQTPRPRFEVRNGVTIHRARATSLGRKSTVRRMVDYLSFYARATLAALALPRFDVVVTLTTPPIIGLIGTILRRFKSSRHVFWSMDLHPDASLALGRMSTKNPVVAGLAKLSDWVYRRADRVVVLGSYMADRIKAKGVRAARISTIPVWSRKDEVYPHPRSANPLREQLGLGGKFVVMYSGNLGLAHSFEEFLEAARRLRERDDVVFLYVGDGPRMDELRRVKEHESLANICVLDYFPREELHYSLSVADLHLLSMRREMIGIVVPGKLYGIMASGRPALFVGPQHCESADTIREAGCGLTVRLGDVAGVIEAIESLAGNAEQAAEMGRRGRAAFLESHERDACCAQWAQLILEVAGVGETAPVAIRMPGAPAFRREVA